MVNKLLLIEYADIIARYGINVQNRQKIVINCDVYSSSFIQVLTERLYVLGAKEVVILWNDTIIENMRYKYAEEEVSGKDFKWMVDFYDYYDRNGAGYINIVSPQYYERENCTNVKHRLTNKASMSSILAEHYTNLFVKNPCCTALVPTYSWAEKVYPQMPIDRAMDELWDDIFRISRILDNAKSFGEHLKTMNNYAMRLNEINFKKLYYENQCGTRLSIELPRDHIWTTACCRTEDGIEFCMNIPSREIYTVPKRIGVNGIFKTQIPMEVNGAIIPDIEFTFERGRLVNYYSSENKEVLDKLLEADSGARYLGEVALVFNEADAVIGKGPLYNALIDENNYCHLALGNAYIDCIKDGNKLSKKNLIGKGVNLSSVHLDFMFDNVNSNIFGETESGERICLMRDGKRYAF